MVLSILNDSFNSSFNFNFFVFTCKNDIAVSVCKWETGILEWTSVQKEENYGIQINVLKRYSGGIQCKTYIAEKNIPHSYWNDSR